MNDAFDQPVPVSLAPEEWLIVCQILQAARRTRKWGGDAKYLYAEITDQVLTNAKA